MLNNFSSFFKKNILFFFLFFLFLVLTHHKIYAEGHFQHIKVFSSDEKERQKQIYLENNDNQCDPLHLLLDIDIDLTQNLGINNLQDLQAKLLGFYFKSFEIEIKTFIKNDNIPVYTNYIKNHTFWIVFTDKKELDDNEMTFFETDNETNNLNKLKIVINNIFTNKNDNFHLILQFYVSYCINIDQKFLLTIMPSEEIIFMHKLSS